MDKNSQIQWTELTRRQKQFCNQNGISHSVYLSRLNQNQKWCTGCKEFHDRSEFNTDKSRFDGLVPSCRQYKNLSVRQSYEPKPSPPKGRRFVPVRDNDEKQARRRVNYLVESSLIPHPNNLPCTDCGHQYTDGERRHEYDHHLGYKKSFHESVQAVCSICHKKRTNERKKSISHG